MAWTGLGIITVITPGVHVSLSATDVRCEAILIQALSNATHTNSGRVYVFDRSGNRIATLAVPTTNTIPSASATIPSAPGGLNTHDYSIDADNAGDGVDASYIRP
jgi:hypothetical protein